MERKDNERGGLVSEEFPGCIVSDFRKKCNQFPKEMKCILLFDA